MVRISKKLNILLFIICALFLFGSQKMQVKAENIVVMIDPGHGGENLGAQQEGYLEKNLSMVVAEAMYDRLNQYEGIDVYLTRNSDMDMTLLERAQAAADIQADFLFCLHFNMSESHRLYGAETWIPAYTYYKTAYRFAYLEMQELTALGLYDRGIKTKLTKKGEDYYGIIREADALGVPCALIEHCHLDNPNDEGYYEDYDKLTALGIADAEAVAKFYGLKSEVLGTDYSNYNTANISIPASETTRDQTPPEVCEISLEKYDKTTGKVDLVLEAKESDSKLIYYDVSFDGGETYSELFPLLFENISFSITIPNGIEPELMVRAYNMYDGYTISNSISLEKTQYPGSENDQDMEGNGSGTTETAGNNLLWPSGDGVENQTLSKMQLFFLCIVFILLLLVSVLLANKLAKYSRRKRARRKKNQYKKS